MYLIGMMSFFRNLPLEMTLEIGDYLDPRDYFCIALVRGLTWQLCQSRMRWKCVLFSRTSLQLKAWSLASWLKIHDDPNGAALVKKLVLSAYWIDRLRLPREYEERILSAQHDGHENVHLKQWQNVLPDTTLRSPSNPSQYEEYDLRSLKVLLASLLPSW